MRRIVVFDNGWGGEVVANYLAQELGVVEIIRVIDWAHLTCGIDGRFEIERVVEYLFPYINKVDLIVLGGYTVGILLNELRKRYPKQLFVAPSINFDKILNVRIYPERVAILSNGVIRNEVMLQELRDKMQLSTLILPDCSDWEGLIDDNMMTSEIIRSELAWDFEVQGKCMPRIKSKEFLAFEMLTEVSPEKRAIMKAIQNFGSAAEQASLEEEKFARMTEQAQIASSEAGRVRMTLDLVLLLNTHFWGIKSEIEQALGWRVRVLDFREKLLHDVCAALRLRGVDGKRAK